MTQQRRDAKISARLGKRSIETITVGIHEELQRGATLEEVRIALASNVYAMIAGLVEFYEPEDQLVISNRIISELNYSLMTRKPKKGRAG